MTLLSLKIDTLYVACSPEFGVVSYGHCEDEALNNLTDELHQQSTYYEKNDHAFR